MIRENLALAPGGLKNCGPAPWRDVRSAFDTPFMHGLDGKARCASEPGGPAERRENVLNHLHEATISEDRITLQESIYPKCVDARIFASRHIIGMSDLAFDADLVRDTMKVRGVTQTDMAKVMGLPSQSAFSNILKGGRRVTAQEAATAYRFLGLVGAGDAPGLQRVPIIGYSSAGAWREAVEVAQGSYPIPTGVAGPRSFAVQVSGDSMDQVIPDGSFVVIDPDQKELTSGKCYLLQNGEHEVTIKCYSRAPARFMPQSNNPEHAEFLVSEHDFAVLGRVVWRGAPM